MKTPHPYRFDRPRLSDVMHDMRITARDRGPGDPVPAFHLPTIDGGRFSRDDLRDLDRSAFVIFGSLTCPVTASAVDGLRALYAAHGDAFRFVLVQVREAHPGERLDQPSSLAAKRSRAAAMRAHFDIPFEVAVDDVEGTLHRALNARPNSAFVLSPDGYIRLHVQWANETAAIDRALRALRTGAAPPRATIRRTAPAMLKAIGYMGPVLSSAGRRAWRDTLRLAPMLAPLIGVASLLRFLPRARRGLAAAALMLAAGLWVMWLSLLG
ncbi:MAG: peroxiredoxin family protein [Vicinamibacterales bacterium]